MDREIRGYSSNIINVSDYNFSIENYFPPEIDKDDIFMRLWKKEYTLEKVSYEKILYTSQSHVSLTFVKKMKSYDSNPKLVKYKNKYWVIDGHHRLIFDRINKRDTFCEIINI